MDVRWRGFQLLAYACTCPRKAREQPLMNGRESKQEHSRKPLRRVSNGVVI